MAIQQTLTASFKLELLQGVHDFTADTFKIALYTAQAALNDETVTYLTDGEVVGAGYTAGGQVLTVVPPAAAIGVTGHYVAFVSFNDVLWPGSDFVARGALIYNASKGNASVAVLNFGGDKISGGAGFRVVFPQATDTSAIIRIE